MLEQSKESPSTTLMEDTKNEDFVYINTCVSIPNYVLLPVSSFFVVPK